MFDSMRGFFEKTTSVLEKTPQQSAASSATSTATNAVTAAGSAAANMSSAALKNVASLVSIPPAQAENLKLIAAASLFGYVGQTLAKDVYVLLRQTKAGRQAYKWAHYHPAAARCILLASSGALFIAWPGTVARLLAAVGGIGITKESGFSYRGGTTGFVGIIQGAAVGRAAAVLTLRKVGIAITALSGVGVLVSLQWRRIRHLYARARSSIKKITGGSGSGSSSSSSGSKGSSSSSSHSKRDKEKEREREGNSSRREYAPPPPPAQPPVASSSSSSGGSRAAAPPPPPPPYEHPHAVTSPPASEHDLDLTDAESIRSSRKSKSRKDKKDKERKHRR